MTDEARDVGERAGAARQKVPVLAAAGLDQNPEDRPLVGDDMRVVQEDGLHVDTGADERPLNIPWLRPGGKYRLTACFADKPLGTFTGKQLQQGALKLTLPPLGQEIVEVKPL